MEFGTVALAARTASATLKESVFQLRSPSTVPERVDTRALLRGAPIGMPAVAAGMAVNRRISCEISGEIGPDAVGSWLERQSDAPVLLHGDAGAGKSTYLHSLIHRLQEDWVFLHWDDHRRFDLGVLENFGGVLASYTDRTPRLCVYSELVPQVDTAKSAEIAAQLLPLQGLSKGVEHTVLLTGRQPEIKNLRLRLPATSAQLLPLDAGEAAALRQQICAAYAASVEEYGQERTRKLYPNLPHFVELDFDRQVLLLREDSKPLLAGLLSAVYGEEARKRVILEYADLDEEDRGAYLQVCLVSAAGSGLPGRLLQDLAPGAALDDRSDHDPWTRDENDVHVARHQTLAQVVLENTRELTRVGAAVRAWAPLAARDAKTGELAWQVFNQLVRWQTVAPETNGRFKSRMRKEVRTALLDEPTFATDLIQARGDELFTMLRWASLLHAMTPKEVSETHLPIIEMTRNLLHAARRATSPSVEVAPHRIDYLLEKTVLLARRATSDDEDAGETTSRLERWASWVGEEWCGSDFYADLFWLAFERVRRWSVGDLERPADTAITERTLRTAITSFEYLRSSSQEMVDRGTEAAYSKLVARHLYALLEDETRITALIRDAWELSCQLRRPNSRTGMHYLRRIPPDDRHERWRVAEEVVRHDRNRHDALLELARMAATPEDRAKVAEYLAVAEEPSRDAMSYAFLRHAVALLEDDRSCRLMAMVAASEAYHRWGRRHGPDARDDWNDIQVGWKELCRTVGQEDPALGQKCHQEWVQVRDRVV